MSKSFKKTIESFLNRLNIFYLPFQFHINSSARVSSFSGSVLTILVALFYIFCTSDMINRTNPIISDEMSTEKYKLEINNHNLAPVIMIYEYDELNGVTFIENSKLDRTYFEITVEKISYFTQIVESYALHDCELKDFDEDLRYKEYYTHGHCFMRKKQLNLDRNILGLEK